MASVARALIQRVAVPITGVNICVDGLDPR